MSDIKAAHQVYSRRRLEGKLMLINKKKSLRALKGKPGSEGKRANELGFC